MVLGRPQEYQRPWIETLCQGSQGFTVVAAHEIDRLFARKIAVNVGGWRLVDFHAHGTPLAIHWTGCVN